MHSLYPVNMRTVGIPWACEWFFSLLTNLVVGGLGFIILVAEWSRPHTNAAISK
jgi:hypothetical protein